MYHAATFRLLKSEPRTSSVANVALREVESRLAAILVWSSDNQADWFIASPDAATLESAVRAVWALDDVGKSLYDSSEIGKAVLEKIQAMA